MNRWHVRLTGDKIDLQYLSDNFKLLENKIYIDGEFYYLESNSFDSIKEEPEIYLKAKDIIEKINEISKYYQNGYRDVKVDHIIYLREDGKSNVTVRVEETFHIRFGGSASVESNINTGNDIPSKLEIILPYLNIAPIKKVFHFYAINDWSNFYKIYEVIREDFNTTKKKLPSVLGINEVDYFKLLDTAQSYSTLGDQSRHAAAIHDNVTNPISFEQAKSLIMEMIKKWLEIKYNFK